MYQKRKKEEGDIAHTFYRADNINVEQLKMMSKRQKSQFISLLGFVSTTSDINIAKGYAQKQKVYENNERVLFVISVKPQLPCTAFAYIDRISFHPEEKEVLFSMGSSFIVDKISEPVEGENYYTINLTASEIDKSLVEDIRVKVESCSPSGRAVLLACYLVELGEYRAARKYLTSLLTQAGDGGVLVNDISLAGVYNCLGTTCIRQGLHSDALKAFKQALNTQARLEYSNNNALAEIHNNIGLAYVGLGHMNEAEATFDKAARMQLREPKSNQQYLASIYGNIGYVHYKQKRFDEAEKSFKKAEKIYKQNTSRIVHDALELSLMKAEFLTNYGHLLSVHRHTKENRKPQDLYNEALKLYKTILPDDDPKLMRTYINIMLAFAKSKSYSEVTKCCDDAVVQKLIERQEDNMFELNSSITQASLGSLYELVGACYASQGHFDKAIQVWKDAYLFERKARLEQLLLVTTDENSSILTAEHNHFIHEWYRKATNHYTYLSR
jgi:tetratricopeptide (TPR) repeat protein